MVSKVPSMIMNSHGGGSRHVSLFKKNILGYFDVAIAMENQYEFTGKIWIIWIELHDQHFHSKL